MPSVIDRRIAVAELILNLGDRRAARDHGGGAAVAKRVERHPSQTRPRERGLEMPA